MKKTYFIMAILLCSLFLSKNTYAQIGVEVNYGLNGVFEPSINDLSHLGGAISYDFDETYGMKIDFASDKFRTKNLLFTEETGIDITRISLQGTMNITTAFSRASSYDFFNLIAHAGAGYSLVKSSYNPGNDNLVNVVMGLTPRFKITDGLYFAIDTSVIFNISQHYNFDGSFSYTEAVNSFTGITYNVTGGIIYKFNENY
jgi:OOP family OmpA-OmpF porin